MSIESVSDLMGVSSKSVRKNMAEVGEAVNKIRQKMKMNRGRNFKQRKIT
jgi:hypothetical protein